MCPLTRPILGRCAHFLEMTGLQESASDDEADASFEFSLSAGSLSPLTSFSPARTSAESQQYEVTSSDFTFDFCYDAWIEIRSGEVGVFSHHESKSL